MNSLIPGDPADEALLGQVCPPGWVNPTPRGRYHLVVVGAGTGGLVTAAAAAGLGARVALVERHLMGGDCLNVGCVPSKALISAARAWHGAASAGERFGGPAVAGSGDFGRAMARMRSLRAGLSPVDGAARFRDLGVDVFLGEGRFVAPNAVAVGGARLEFRRGVVATGARAAVPAISGLAESGYLTNETVFTLTECPKHLVVIGAGPVGCELAQTFRRFGAAVTLLTRDDRILPKDDGAAALLVQRRLEAEGIVIVTKARIERVDRKGNHSVVVVTGVGSFEADRILVAAGRAPNVDGLGLDQAGVRFDARGVSVDDRLRTSNPAIFAVGDVCTPFQFTHVADFHARLVVQNALFFGRGKASALVIPWCTYTSPEVAQVGLTVDQAKAAGRPVDVVEVGFEHVDRAVLDGQETGLLKVILAQGTDRILGATLVADHAGEMIGEIAVAMTNGLGLGAIGRTIHPYPTQSEVFRKAADQWRRRKLTPLVKVLFRKWFSVFR